MDTLKERRAWLEASNKYLSGDALPGVKYLHNSEVLFTEEDGTEVRGWIVAVGPVEPEPIFTVERADGGGDEEILEGRLTLVGDPPN